MTGSPPSMPWVHSANPKGQWHRLDDHLRSTGHLAEGFADVFGAGSLARWLGRSHDIGKAPCAWQEALDTAARTGGPTGVPHKQHAARLARELGGHPKRIQAVLGAAALLGHHSGMPDYETAVAGRLAVKTVLSVAELDGELGDAVALLRAAGLGDLRAEAAAVTLPGWLPIDAAACHDAAAKRRLDMFTRMVFSALVDADYLDTEQHFDAAPRPRIADAADMRVLQDDFAASRSRLLAGAGPPSHVDRVREAVYEQAVAAAQHPPGLFRLPAPTGAGKTWAVAGFGLRHARVHDLRRIVVAVPFTSITTQNAAVYRQMLDRTGQRRVLEHHSAVLDGDVGPSRWRRLAAQNWDAPFIVTTTVQLFESLLSNRPSKARRLHRLARSVIILDEVQALPLPLLPVLLEVLQTLVRDYGSTVVLSTATPPAFWALPVWQDFPSTSLLADEATVRSSLRRVTYQWRTEVPATWPTVAEWLRGERQALAVLNTTRDAQDLHRTVQASAPAGTAVLHLSTRMCPAHRRDVLHRTRQLLADGQPVLVVSTQVVEAGVDVDFPAVFRALAPAESIAQAAGRCNREGRLPEPGPVVVFVPEDGHVPPGHYATATALTRQRFADRAVDPDDPDALRSYYESLYSSLLPDGQSPIGSTVTKARTEWAFRVTAEKFHMIDDTGVPVVVEYDDPDNRALALVTRLRNGNPLQPDDWRFLQSRTATLPRTTAVATRTAGEANTVGPPGHDESRTTDVLWWKGTYHDERGIETGQPLAAEEGIW